MKKFTSIQVIAIVLISLLLGYYFGVNKVSLDWKNYQPKFEVVNKEPPSDTVSVDFGPFWTVWQKLEQDYYDKSKLDQKKMLTGAINGMVGALGDPFTLYLPPVQNSNFKQSLSGEFSGIGAELGTKNNAIIVIAPLDGSPAQKAGIKAGDTIVKVDGQSTAGWSTSQAVDKIRGPKGTSIEISVLHKNQTNPIDVQIVRDTINVKSVVSWVKKASDIDSINLKNNNSVAYIRLSQFGDNTNKEWSALMPGLLSQIKAQNASGVILDLRSNPGGYLTDATYIASEFLSQGTPVVSEQDETGEKTTLNADRNGLLQNYKLIILIDRGSASASEIVSGALRDNKKALLYGEKSFGKGTVQQAEDLGDGAGLHITIAKWLTPDGTWVNGVGLTPDVSVANDTKDPSHDAVLEKAVSDLIK